MTGSIRKAWSWVAPVARVAAGGVLVVSGYLKAVRPAVEFAAKLDSYWIFPPLLVGPLSLGVPWVEMWVGLALVAGYFSRVSALLAAGLYAVFVGALGQALVRKLPLNDCGCFGAVGPQLEPHQMLIMDGLLLLLCVGIFFDKENRGSADRWIERP